MALALTIGGVAKTSLLLVDSLQFSRQAGGAGSLSFTLTDTEAAYCPAIGASVSLTDGATTHFAGVVASTRNAPFYSPAGTGDTVWRVGVNCTDYSTLASRYLVAEEYTGDTAGTIVAALRAAYLAADGVTDGTIEAGPVVTKVIFNYQSLATCLDEMATHAGMIWYIDNAKALQFHARDSSAAAWDLTALTQIRPGLTIETSTRGYRNRQIVRAGVDLTSSRTDSFKGDGTAKTWTLAFPCGSVPTGTVNAVSKTFGVRGVDTGKDWYYQFGSNQITQSDGASALTTSQTLAVTYQGQFPIIAVADLDAEITARAAAEGGSGIYESLISDPNVNGSDSAYEMADAYLSRYGEIPEVVTYSTDTAGLVPGAIQTITLSTYGLNDAYLIDQVSARPISLGTGGHLMRYSVRALSGEHLGGWQSFFRKLLGSQKHVLRENEMLQLIRFPGARPDAVTCSDSLAADVADPANVGKIGTATVGFSECPS